MDFCKQYNERTASQAGMIIPVEITVFEDRTFTFITKTPPASFLIKQALKIESGSKEPNRNKVGKLTQKQLEEIAKREDARHQRQRHRCGQEDHRRHRSLDGRRGGSVMPQHHGKRFKKLVAGLRQPRLCFDAPKRSPLVKKNANAKFNETVEAHVRLGRGPEEERSERARHGAAAARNGTNGARDRVRQGRQREGSARRPAPTSSAIRI